MVMLLTITLRMEWARSLKDKRGEVKSLLARLKNKFNVSVAETGRQNEHTFAEIGVAALVPSAAMADSVAGEVMRFVLVGTDAEVVAEERLLLQGSQAEAPGE